MSVREMNMRDEYARECERVRERLATTRQLFSHTNSLLSKLQGRTDGLANKGRTFLKVKNGIIKPTVPHFIVVCCTILLAYWLIKNIPTSIKNFDQSKNPACATQR